MDQYSLFAMLAPVACALTLITTVYCFRHQNTPAAKPLGYTTLFTGLYILANFLELTNPTPSGTLLFAKICYIFIGLITISWFIFALTFTHKKEKFSKSILLMNLIPLVTVVLLFTRSGQHFIWNSFEFIPVSHGFLYMKVTTYGFFFWIFWIQAYLLILGSGIMALWVSFFERNRFRSQAVLVAVASFFPLVINAIYVLHLVPGLQKDFSPLAYACSVALMTFSIFKFRLLDLSPFARSVLIDEMTDGMLTLSKQRQIVDFNKAAEKILKLDGATRSAGSLTDELILPCIDTLENDPASDLFQTELKMGAGLEAAYYDMQIRRLRNQTDAAVVGYLILLHSITEHKNLLQRIQVLAEHDILTGLFNRKYFEEAANQLIQCGGGVFSILMTDIDYFKDVNDSVGHRGGDQVLQAVAQRLQKTLRSGDIIGRFGGDEFVVLLPDTTAESAKALADRLCASIAESPYHTDENAEFSLSISVGISEFSEENKGTLDQIIVQADQALYQAKTEGRNRAVVYERRNPVQN